MATFTLRKGNHAHVWPPNSTWPWIGERSMSRLVMFSPECAYTLDAYHAQDANKLFGLSFGLGGVHHNSARFGWRYNATNDCIDLVAYVYLNGIRTQDTQLNFPLVAQVKLGEKVECNIEYDADDGFTFSVYTEHGGYYGSASVQTAVVLPKYGLTHGLYWGGSTLCPHEMKVQIDRI